MPPSREALGLRSETVRRNNLSAILRELHLHGPLSRSELVARTGLTRSAIRGLIGEFVAAGFVTEERSAPLGTPGRPSPLVRLNPDSATVLALEITVDSVAAAVVTIGGGVRELVRTDRERGQLSVEDTIARLVDLAGPMLAQLPHPEALVGAGVAVAAVVRRSDGMVRMAPNLGWRDVPLSEELARGLGLEVPIHVANEADLGALAEQRRGVATGVSNLLYIQGEVGVGGGVIINGAPLNGAAGYGGEVGHLPVNPNGTACGCGSFGCWETEIGERALLARAGESPTGGRQGVEAVIAAAEAGSPRALAALDRVGEWLGIGLVALVNILNPQLIVLGGRLARIHPFVADRVSSVLAQRALPASRELVKVLPAALGADAPVLGAAELAFAPLLADPAAWLATPSDAMHLVSA